jgi:hypothetical protein
MKEQMRNVIDESVGRVDLEQTARSIWYNCPGNGELHSNLLILTTRTRPKEWAFYTRGGWIHRGMVPREKIDAVDNCLVMAVVRAFEAMHHGYFEGLSEEELWVIVEDARQRLAGLLAERFRVTGMIH